MNRFTVLIPARLSSSRLPEKALADIHGKPMVVRVAEQAAKSCASRIVVATDHESIAAACRQHHVEVVLTADTHESGTTRLAEAAERLQLADQEIVVNVQGDEPLIDPELINCVADVLADNRTPMATAAHAITSFDDFMNPNVVKVVLTANNRAVYFSRAPIPFPRNTMLAGKNELPTDPAPLRHIGLYAYRVSFLKEYSALPASPLEHTESLEQLRVLWHGREIAVHISPNAPAAGVDTIADLERVRQIFPQT